MTDKIVVLSTAESPEQGETLARALVEARYAACVNIVPGVRSIYRWESAVQDSAEVILVIKTHRALLLQVEETIRRLHSYTLPEVIALPILDGSEDYLDWIDTATNPPQP